MKTVRKITSSFLVLVLLLTLGGCSAPGAPDSKEEDLNRLQGLLNQISTNVQAGKSPITASLAADFVSWAATTQLTRQETAQAAADWLASQTPELRRAAEEKLNALMEQMSQFLKDGTENLKNSDWDISSILKDILASGGL